MRSLEPISSSMRGTSSLVPPGSGPRNGGDRGGSGVRIGIGAAHDAHHAAGAVLFVIGVEDEKHLQSAREHGGSQRASARSSSTLHNMFM
jgi:hypothetical protein